MGTYPGDQASGTQSAPGTRMSPRNKPVKTLSSILRLLLQLPQHQAAVPSNHLSPPPFLLRRHPRLHHLLLCHCPLLHPLQPPWLPHPLCSLPRSGHLSPWPPHAGPSCRPCHLLSRNLPAPPLRSDPPPALCPQTPCAPLAPCQLEPWIPWSQCSMD